MGILDRIKLAIKWLIGNGVATNQENIGKLLGYNNKSSFSQLLNGRVPIPKDFIDRLSNLHPNINPVWIENGEGNMLKDSQPEAVIIDNPALIYVPMVSQYAYAGYLCGYADEEYIETLPTIPFIGDHLPKGEYMAFEVRGDSMEDGTDESLLEGDILMCRKIKQELWRNKLHIKKWDFVIVHKTEGVLVKRIIEHDVENCIITIHSLNDMYSDRKIHLNDVAQLFNVIQVSRSRRR